MCSAQEEINSSPVILEMLTLTENSFYAILNVCVANYSKIKYQCVLFQCVQVVSGHFN